MDNEREKLCNLSHAGELIMLLAKCLPEIKANAKYADLLESHLDSLK